MVLSRGIAGDFRIHHRSPILEGLLPRPYLFSKGNMIEGHNGHSYTYHLKLFNEHKINEHLRARLAIPQVCAGKLLEFSPIFHPMYY